MMNGKIKILEERISVEEYIDFLKRTDLGSQYPKERFEGRIAKLVKNVSISLVARNEMGDVVGVLFAKHPFLEISINPLSIKFLKAFWAVEEGKIFSAKVIVYSTWIPPLAQSSIYK